jgi:four helix bundle protein
MTVKNYKELIVWQKSMTAVTLLYSLVKKLPKEELFALSDQMRRCAVSIPSNIAEGQQRTSGAEFLKFISYAQGSRAELETQLLICVSIGYMTEDDISELMSLLNEINKMLSALERTLPPSK